jgi:ppGpp synthetase/RelA/SpoT-type nucleotidyltranferase
VSPRRPDIWKPPPEKTYSKEAVNRAGELLRRFFHTQRPSGADVFDGFDSNKVIEAMYAVTWWKQLHAVPLSKVGANLRYHVMKEDGEVEGRIDVAQRLKKRDTIIDKLDRYPKMKLTRMHDIGGVRATLPSLSCLYAVSRRLRKTWTIANTRDYVAEPKESGYRAIHHEVVRDGKVIEVQLRTFRQHAWANQVEDDGRALGTGYKFGFGDEDIHAYYRAVSEIFWAVDSEQSLPDGLQDELRARYEKIKDVLRPQTSRRPK